MRAFILVLSLVLSSFASADPIRREPKTIPALKQKLEVEKDPAQAHLALSEIVGKYASEKITAENSQEAKTYAEALLAKNEQFKNWNYGNAIHHAHLVLGRVHLFGGRIEDAKKELVAAGLTPGSPQLNSFGPNMTLAKELLEKGEKAAVLAYFDACLKFWKSEFGKPKVAEWKAAIAKGGIPKFGAHLVY